MGKPQGTGKKKKKKLTSKTLKVHVSAATTETSQRYLYEKNLNNLPHHVSILCLSKRLVFLCLLSLYHQCQQASGPSWGSLGVGWGGTDDEGTGWQISLEKRNRRVQFLPPPPFSLTFLFEIISNFEKIVRLEPKTPVYPSPRILRVLPILMMSLFFSFIEI